MAKHSNGKNNYAVSKSLIGLVVVIIVLISGVLWWLSTKNSSTSTAKNCIQGELVLPIASSDKDGAQKVIDAYNKAGRTVRDHCVVAKLNQDIKVAGVYLSSESDNTINQELKKASRSPATLEWPTVATDKVGVASKTGLASFDAATNVAYPVKSDAVASTLVAAKLHKNNVDATKTALDASLKLTIEEAVNQQSETIAIAESNLPSGYSFVAAEGLTKPLRAVALNATDAVPEDIIRAGADFGAAIANNAADIKPEDKSSPESVTAAEVLATLQTQTSEGTDKPESSPPAQPADTLFLLDTSLNMGKATPDGGSWQSHAAQAIIQASTKLESLGKNLALWNYSSPLSHGATHGWRDNIGFGTAESAETISRVIQEFGVGGHPLTHEATVAALSVANARVQEGHAVNLVIVTSGTEDSSVSLADIPKNSQLRINVVHVGAAPVDQELAQAAQASGGSAQVVEDPLQIKAAIDKASQL
ncbi:VWA domain-containing protein [Corynebacterium pseudotuberculosis]|uniref:VWA domain-containing protein n=1 Tax=Corynebacterium pseudotuberculosis TaxID=1719 RepID=UPI002FF68925